MEVRSESVLAGPLAAPAPSQAAESPAWPVPAPLSTTGALSVDAARLLGLEAAEERPEHPPPATSREAGPSGLAAANGSKDPRTGAMTTIMAALRRLIGRERAGKAKKAPRTSL